MTETQNPSVQQKPCIPTISHMKKPPVSGGLPVSWAAAGVLTRLRPRST